jgi:hypothetical protein
MSGSQPPTEDKYARGLGLAAGAILTQLLRALVDNGALSRGETRQLLSDARAGFVHPGATDIEAAAAASIVRIGNDAVSQAP